MSLPTLSALISIIIYITGFCFAIKAIREKQQLKFILYGTVFALIAHGFSLTNRIFLPEGINLDLFSILSLSGWLIVAMTFVLSLAHSWHNLALITLPFGALTVALPIFFTSHYVPKNDLSIAIVFHILLSISAYSVLTLATAEAILLALQNYLLKSKQHFKFINALPPMEWMESSLLLTLWVGMVLLSCSIFTGLLFHQDLIGQHLAHKTAFSIAAWVIFAILLGGWHWLGWRGIRIIRWVFSGFFLLMIGVIGSKIVLEIILK